MTANYELAKLQIIKRNYMKPEIENLKMWMSGRSTTGYQRALAMREFEQLLTYVEELEQLRQPPGSGECEHPYHAVLGDGEMQPAKCLKCGKVL